MNWLIWREYRLNRMILIVGLGLLLLPYAFAVMVLCWARFHPGLFQVFGLAALYSVILTQLTSALLGGNAIAGERNDRSAQFVAYLPLSRARRLKAKLSVILAATGVLWGVNLLILLIVFGTAPESELRRLDVFSSVPSLLGYSAITGLVIFGVAWLVSSLQSSPTFAVCGGLITPLVILMCLRGAAWTTGPPTFDRFAAIGYFATCSLVAVVCFSIGTWHFLRRIEP